MLLFAPLLSPSKPVPGRRHARQSSWNVRPWDRERPYYKRCRAWSVQLHRILPCLAANYTPVLGVTGGETTTVGGKRHGVEESGQVLAPAGVQGPDLPANVRSKQMFHNARIWTSLPAFEPLLPDCRLPRGPGSVTGDTGSCDRCHYVPVCPVPAQPCPARSGGDKRASSYYLGMFPSRRVVALQVTVRRQCGITLRL